MSRRSAPSTPAIEPWQVGGLRSRASVAAKRGAGSMAKSRTLTIETQGARLMCARFAVEICPGTRPPHVHGNAPTLHREDDLLDAVAQFGE